MNAREHAWRAARFFFNDTATTEIYTLSLHDALPISDGRSQVGKNGVASLANLFVCRSSALRPRAWRPQLKRDPLGDPCRSLVCTSLPLLTDMLPSAGIQRRGPPCVSHCLPHWYF